MNANVKKGRENGLWSHQHHSVRLMKYIADTEMDLGLRLQEVRGCLTSYIEAYRAGDVERLTLLVFLGGNLRNLSVASNSSLLIASSYME